MKYHPDLTLEHWSTFSICMQMANIGCEVSRAFKWRKRGDEELAVVSFYRVLELIDLSVADEKNRKAGRLRELLRVREALVDFFMYDNIYKSTEEAWENYFMWFNFAAAKERGV